MHWTVIRMRKAIITAAPNFDAEAMKILTDGLKERFEGIEISTVVNSASAGGFTVDIDGTVYDMSVEAQLKKLKTHLCE